MLELQGSVFATTDQAPTVNCQLIVRSELLELPYLDLLTRLRDEVEENPALELECEHPLEEIPYTGSDYSFVTPRKCVRDESLIGGAVRDPVAGAPATHDLRDELLRRIGWVTSGRLREIAAHLIEDIDERGYLSAKTLEVALDLQADPLEVEEAVRAIQLIAPPGVGARDLKECLRLLLDALPAQPGHVRQVVEHCEQALERGGWEGLQAALDISAEQLSEALNLIRTKLSPYPGEQFRTCWQHLLPGNPHAARPDVVLEVRGGEITVELTTSRTLNLRMAEAYRCLETRMRDSCVRADDEQTRRVRANVRAARQIIWSLQQREQSLYRISRAIAKQQRSFLLEGPLAHRPLTHKRIAELTGLHESTVSRATAGKLVQLPCGESVTFNVFFDDALPARTVLRRLVSEEPSSEPLTDEQLQEAMAAEGFDLARRTVNKYRRALGIPSSTDRRRIYRAA